METLLIAHSAFTAKVARWLPGLVFVLPAILVLRAESIQQQGITAAPAALASVVGFPLPTNLVVTFPSAFESLPALQAVPNHIGAKALPIVSMTTNGFTAEVRLSPHALLDTAPEPVSEDICLAFADGLPVLVSVNRNDSSVSLAQANSVDGQGAWTEHRVDLTQPAPQFGHPLAATITGSKLCLLWVGNHGLCVTRAADAWGAQPWTSEVLASTVVNAARSSIAEVGGRLVVSVVQVTDLAQLTVWIESPDIPGDWRECHLGSLVMPSYPWRAARQVFATRVGSVSGKVCVSMSIQNYHFVSPFRQPPYLYLGDDLSVAYLAEEAAGSMQWTKWNKGVYQGLGSGPLDQWVDFHGQTAVLSRWVGVKFQANFEVERPKLWIWPSKIQWTAASHARLKPPEIGIFDPYFNQYSAIHGFGVPGRDYVLLQTRSLAQPNWERLAPITADCSGVLSFDLLDPSTESGFLRLEEIQP